MNSPASILTVNPSHQAEGAKYPEITTGLLRCRYLSSRPAASPRLRRAISFLLGSTLTKGIPANASAFGLRLILAAVCAFSIFLFSGLLSTASTVAMAVCSLMILFGLFTRPAALAISAVCVFQIVSILQGVYDNGAGTYLLILQVSATLLALTLSIIGAGEVSVDARIRRSIYKNIKRRRDANLEAKRISYQALMWHER